LARGANGGWWCDAASVALACATARRSVGAALLAAAVVGREQVRFDDVLLNPHRTGLRRCWRRWALPSALRRTTRHLEPVGLAIRGARA
jgi:hypothetical protein